MRDWENEETLEDKLNYIFKDFPDNSDSQDYSDDESLPDLDMTRVRRIVYN